MSDDITAEVGSVAAIQLRAALARVHALEAELAEGDAVLATVASQRDDAECRITVALAAMVPIRDRHRSPHARDTADRAITALLPRKTL